MEVLGGRTCHSYVLAEVKIPVVVLPQRAGSVDLGSQLPGSFEQPIKKCLSLDRTFTDVLELFDRLLPTPLRH